MKKLMKWLESKTKKMGILDFAILKICLLTLGIIIGAYIWAFVRNWIWVFVSVAAVTWIVLLVRFFTKK